MEGAPAEPRPAALPRASSEAAHPRAQSNELRIPCAPAQHWTRRSIGGTNGRLWGSFVVRGGGRAVYFGGDSGYFHGYAEIDRRLGPLDAVLMPTGAYEARWFTAAAHMNPEEAVRAYRELGGTGTFVPIHGGTFRLTDEDPLEPPRRLRSAWAEAGLPPERLCVLRHGETVVPSPPPGE